jgi:hypothetical protein
MLKVANSVINASQIATPITFVGDVTLSTGNLVIGTAGKGIDFSVTSHPAGMTSELLSDYEEGTFTPDQGSGLTVVGAFSSSGAYVRVGRLIVVEGFVSGASTIACTANGTICTNLPFAAGVSLNAVGVAFTGSANHVVYGTASANEMRSNLAIGAVSAGINFTMSYMTA